MHFFSELSQCRPVISFSQFTEIHSVRDEHVTQGN